MSNIFDKLEMENQSPEEVNQSLESIQENNSKKNNFGQGACAGGYCGISNNYSFYYRNEAINLSSVGF